MAQDIYVKHVLLMAKIVLRIINVIILLHIVDLQKLKISHGTIISIVNEVKAAIVYVVVLAQRRRHRSTSSSQMNCMTRCK